MVNSAVAKCHHDLLSDTNVVRFKDLARHNTEIIRKATRFCAHKGAKIVKVNRANHSLLSEVLHSMQLLCITVLFAYTQRTVGDLAGRFRSCSMKSGTRSVSSSCL